MRRRRPESGEALLSLAHSRRCPEENVGVRSVSVLVRDGRGRTLLQFRDAFAQTFPLLWGFWGGAMSPVDASPAHCAARELEEELGVRASPADFTRVGVRESSTGEAWLMRFGKPLEWADFVVQEGAGAAFFWRHEMLRLPVAKPLADHLRTDPDLFGDLSEP
jgi:8-oxo-dGTP pyrophosphatase MutT (NUDIX family)